MNNTYRVTMVEVRNGQRHTITQTAVAPSQSAVIDWYGLREPDIIDYKIEKI